MKKQRCEVGIAQETYLKCTCTSAFPFLSNQTRKSSTLHLLIAVVQQSNVGFLVLANMSSKDVDYGAIRCMHLHEDEGRQDQAQPLSSSAAAASCLRRLARPQPVGETVVMPGRFDGCILPEECNVGGNKTNKK
jgi:hypothetical protein